MGLRKTHCFRYSCYSRNSRISAAWPQADQLDCSVVSGRSLGSKVADALEHLPARTAFAPAWFSTSAAMPRPAQLVCQQLEKIPREALKEYQRIVRNYVRGRHGIYALYRRGKLYYMGLASNLRSRLNTHLTDRHAQSWDRFSVYLTIDDRHLKDLESLLLRMMRPDGNKQSGKFVQCQDLCPDFRRRIKEHQKIVLDHVFDEQQEPSPPREASRQAGLLRCGITRTGLRGCGPGIRERCSGLEFDATDPSDSTARRTDRPLPPAAPRCAAAATAGSSGNSSAPPAPG